MWSRSQSPPAGSSPSPPPPTRQSKVVSQREYREREGESFNMLRDVIRILTGEEPRTRLEVLRKAIDLLVTSEIGNGNNREGFARIGTLGVAENEAPTSISVPGDAALDRSGHLTQTSHQTQTWQSRSDTGLTVAAPRYDTRFLDSQQYHGTSTVDSTFNHFDSFGSGEDSSSYLQFGRPF